MTDEELWQAVHEGTLAEPLWTHEAHVRIAWMYLRKFTLDEAHILMRVAIIRLNTVQGLVETPTRGYHDTLTRAWLVLVAAAMRDPMLAEDSAVFWRAAGLRSDAPLAHYSRELLFSPTARARFIEPDLRPLPA